MPGLSFPKRAIAAVVLILTATAVAAAPSSASAEVEVLKPVRTGAHSMIFELDGVQPAAIRRVTAHNKALRYRIRQQLARYEGRPYARSRAATRMRRQLHRRVRVSEVRSAAADGGRYSVSKPTWGGKGVMKLGIKAGAIVTSGPSGKIATNSATYEFTTAAPDATFQCRLDAAAFSPCTSPQGYAGLADGEHTFEVQAFDATGAPDGSPASRSFTVDTNPDDDQFSVENHPEASWNIFSDASPWNRQIDRGRVAQNSEVMIDKMLADGDPSTVSPQLNQNWGTPTYYGQASDPVYTLDFTGNFDYTREIDGAQIHVPAGAKPSAGTDGVIWVIDQTDGFLYAIQQAVIDHQARTISAWKGYRLAADGLGFRYPSGPPTGVQPIRPEELAAGYVNHAISMGVRCLSGHPVAPFDQSQTIGKTCSGDTNPASTRLSMGSVVFLDMSHAQIEALHIATWEEAILKGLADHGAVVGLNGGSPWTFKFENRLDRTSLGEPDPYAAAGLPATLDYSDALDEVGGWDAKLKVLQPFARPCSGVC